MIKNKYNKTFVSKSYPAIFILNYFYCRAVRRAEQFAESSGRDPRHVYVPRDTTDDINYKVDLNTFIC